MLTDRQIQALEAAWSPARRNGALGTASIRELYDHAAGYVPAASVVVDDIACVDAGSGAGVPGVLLALHLPRSGWRLVDASSRRCEFAAAAVRALDLAGRVEVVHGRVDELAHEPHWRGSADLVVARLFGPPAEVAECTLPLVREGGALVVSASGVTLPMWRTADLSSLGGEFDAEWSTEAGGYVRVRGTGAADSPFPRRVARRRREPLFE